MFFSREIIGIPVIHVASGRELGRVKEWLLDRYGKAVVALVAEGSGWLPQTKIFLFREISALGSDAVLVNQEGNAFAEGTPELEEQPAFSVLGKRIYREDGRELGVVEDVLFDGVTGQVTGWRLSSGLIDDLLSGRPVLKSDPHFNVGKDVLIMRDSNLPELQDL